MKQPQEMNFLIVPGLYDSDAQHWQSRWEKTFDLPRMQQADWTKLNIGVWAGSLERAVLQVPPAVTLLAHSFGCLAVAFAAERLSERIGAAFLVAPADPAKFDFIERFSEEPLPFPSILVASRNDPWLGFDRAQRLAAQWQSDFVDVGNKGHINSLAGLEDWPAGWELAQLLARTPHRLAQRQPAKGSRQRRTDFLAQSFTEVRYAE